MCALAPAGQSVATTSDQPDDPEAQGEAILEESDERTLARDGSPDADVEHRTSDQATLPPD
ncbi:MAG TPA: hypothetical protein VID05_00080 [Acidimicrobiales bacterium]